MSKIINTNIRLNLSREDDRRAWEYLQELDRKQYKSYSRAVVAAVIDYFDRKGRLDADPYLETREKEDAFLQRVLETMQTGLQSTAPLTGLIQLLSGAAATVPTPEAVAQVEDTALNFADSF